VRMSHSHISHGAIFNFDSPVCDGLANEMIMYVDMFGAHVVVVF
jgi:hypothetical protein